MDRRLGAHVDAERAVALDEQVGELRVEALEHVRRAVQHGHLGAGRVCEPGELERDVAAADEADARRQLVQLEELRACGDELRARHAEVHRPGAGRQHHVPSLEHAAVHLRFVRAAQTCRAVQGLRAGVPHPALDALGHGGGVRALARHEGRPVDAGPADQPVAVQAARPAHGLRGRQQHLLRVAAALRAGPAVGQAVHDRHPQALLRAARRHVLRGRTAADHQDVVRVVHLDLLSTWRLVMPAGAPRECGGRFRRAAARRRWWRGGGGRTGGGGEGRGGSGERPSPPVRAPW